MLPIATILCPHCLEQFDVPVDALPGTLTYVEDCPVCCHPILLAVEIDPAGALQSVTARREND